MMSMILENIARFLYVVVALGIVVFVHELGHFLSARKVGVKVEKFYLGMGKEIIGFDYKGTRYGIALFPVGGMVKLAGEEMTGEASSPGDFYYQPWYNRLLVAVSGALMNLVFAIVVFSIIIKLSGLSVPINEPIVGNLRENMPAHKAGLQLGDKIISADGQKIKTWQELASYIHARPDNKIVLEVERSISSGAVSSQKIFKVTVIPIKSESDGGIGLIGITPPLKTTEATWLNSIWLGINKSVWLNYMTLAYLWESITKARKPEVAGPVGIIGELAKASKRGIMELMSYLALISNALALFNLLPIPILDGGLATFFIFEGITRKPLNEKLMAKINLVGLAILLTIFVYATYGDVLRIATSK